MCGRATVRRGELRLAKLSLAVSDSFLSERKEEAGRREEGRTWRALRYPQSCLFSIPPLLRSSGRSRATDFQFFFELHATSSRSNSLLHPSPCLRLLCSFSLSFSCPLFTSVPLSSKLFRSLSPILANRSW